MKIILPIIALFIFSVSNLFALQVTHLNDNFSGTSLNTDIWNETVLYMTNSIFYENSGSSYINTTVNDQYEIHTVVDDGGVAELQTNYYFLEDFDAQIDVYQYRNNGNSHFLGFNFFKAGSNNYTESTLGTNWGFAAGVKYNYADQQTLNLLSYNAFLVPENTWYQLRIQRIGDNVYTYYRLIGEETWTLQNSYIGFGGDSVFLTAIGGDGSSYLSSETYFDNFLATGYADTNPEATIPIPEPTSVILVGLSIIGLIKKNKSVNI